ncbi:MAG: chorismate synthase [Methanocellales archaeon]|nr:chorismate synthase [Methanocellales archaeon]MDD3291228.1 chorismate synthase [Methanocellales archaeon]MDD5235400.1 chorismate synthase [Methanocellales archaeon]MDD5484517.1 chorismate synthase [Methanocellales archaeon]
MGGNSFGDVFRITTWGESHGKAVGVVLDGCPAGLELFEADIQAELDRRRPGQSIVASTREETDKIEILSGVFDGKTTGTPISMLVQNVDVDSSKYESLRYVPRPGHADFTYEAKYGIRDWRGGGRSSARETVARVAGGAIAKKLLKSQKIEILGHVIRIGGISVGGTTLDQIRENVEQNMVRCADMETAERMLQHIQKVQANKDSVGGIVEIIALNVPAGVGEPVFDKLDADLAKALMSIGSVKGVEIGVGFGCATMRGSEMNDPFVLRKGIVRTDTNNAGGILGGVSNGMPIACRIAVKPTPSIERTQKTVDLAEKEERDIQIKGRHDPCICPRIVPVAEAMVALVLADQMIRGGFIRPSK